MYNIIHGEATIANIEKNRYHFNISHKVWYGCVSCEQMPVSKLVAVIFYLQSLYAPFNFREFESFTCYIYVLSGHIHITILQAEMRGYGVYSEPHNAYAAYTMLYVS